MTTIAVAARSASLPLSHVPAELPVPPVLSRARLWWGRVTYWPTEILAAGALVCLLPVVIYALCLPIALVANAVFFLATGSWKGFWQ
jgi:hypothetical protein